MREILIAAGVVAVIVLMVFVVWAVSLPDSAPTFNLR